MSIFGPLDRNRVYKEPVRLWAQLRQGEKEADRESLQTGSRMPTLFQGGYLWQKVFVSC